MSEKTTSETELRTLPIHVSLLRPILFGGADRELTLANGIICIALIFGIGISKYTLGIVALLLTAGQWGLSRVTDYDPLFRHVYLRHVRLQDYYVAAPSARSRPGIVHPGVPFTG